MPYSAWLALVVALWFGLLVVAGISLVAIGQGYDSSTMNILGLLLVLGGLVSLALMTPVGAARVGGRTAVASWFRGMTGAAGGIAFAFLAGYAALPAGESSKAFSDLGAVAIAGVVALGSAFLLLKLGIEAATSEHTTG